MDDRASERAQRALCDRYGAEFVPSALSGKIGIAEDVRSGLLPVNGLRHLPVGDTTGWYLWAGDELKGDPDYFKPLHLEHLDEWCPGLMKFMGLAPGWRLQVAPGHEDVWFDPALLVE